MTIADLQTEPLRNVCRAHNVRELFAFGSVVSGDYTDGSDLDFIVRFESDAVAGAFDRFMSFKEELEKLFGRPVDLLSLKRFRNPVFQAEVDRSKVLVYAA